MKHLLATGDGYTAEHLDRLRAIGYQVTHLPGEPSRSELMERLSEAHVHILGGPERLSAEDISQARKLEFICFVGTGHGAFVDEAAARDRGIEIANTPGLVTSTVAEYTIGMLIAARRKIRSQPQDKALDFAGICDLADCHIGILGLGEIGGRVAAILSLGLELRVKYHSRTRKRSLENKLNLVYCSLDELFESCDTIVVLLPTSPQTRGMVDDRRLKSMPRHSVLVNTAGAWLVEPNALREALVSGHLEMAAFDGYYVEPLPSVEDDEFGLLGLGGGKFFVTPHIAAKTAGVWPRMVSAAVQTVIQRAKSTP